jgi:hypothetical protein
VLALAVLIVLLARNWSGHLLWDLGAVVIASVLILFLVWWSWMTGELS